MRKVKDSHESSTLLRRAEEQIKRQNPRESWAFTNDGIQKLVHELQVHQVELEMQNEELRAAEEAARINAEKYAALYDFFPAGYFTLTSKGAISELNLIAATLLGKERSNLINCDFKSFLSANSWLVFNKFLKDIFELQTRQSCEVTLNIAGTSSAFVHLEGLISEHMDSCFMTAVDISLFKEGTGNLRESELRYRRLFETSKDGILILDAVSGEIIDVNPSLIQLLGYNYDELLGKQLWEIGTFKNIGYSQFAFTELQIIGYIRYEDMPLLTKTGKSISVEFVSNVYLAENKKVIQCNIRDITERKQLEKALKESEARLRELNSTKDKFFSIIAHDLRGPFNSIMGFSELMVEQTQEKNYEEVERYASIIYQSSQRAMELVTNLLEWSRSKVGRLQFNPENIDIGELIKSVVQLLKDSAQHKSITIYTDVSPGLQVRADRAMLATILRNLVSNAIKFTKPDGEIVVSVQKEQYQLSFMVADNGIGIKKEAINKLFDMDASYSTPGTQDEKGTGLGLLLCKEFIERHGGDLRVESELGKGSKFYFTIPQSIKKSYAQSDGTSKRNNS
ncbi:MAG TPA: PAS domain-containing sensor histidine kinase [Prolixibacteraceae bacterium]|jgi:PAS domain S-box-containing protein